MRYLRSGFGITVLLFALTGCTDDPKTSEHWDKKLNSARRVREKTHILSELRESGYLNQSMIPMLNANMAKEKSPEVKGEIAHLLASFKDPSSVQPLMDAIDFGNADRAGNAMNKEIAAALGQIGDPRATPTLLRLLRSKDSYVRIEAINAVGAMHAKDAVDLLLEITSDDSSEPFIVKKAIQALGDIGDARAVPRLLKMLFKEKRGMTFYPESSFALFQIGRPASDALLAVIRGEDRSLMAWAKENNVLTPAIYAKSAQILGDLNEMRAVKPLLSQLGFQSEYLDIQLFVRMGAADALGRLRAQEAVKPMVSLLEDTDEPAAQREYARALFNIGGRDAIPGLEKAAAAKDWDTREQAFLCLGMLGDDREAATFEKRMKEEDSLTHAECKEDPDAAACRDLDKSVKGHLGVIQKYQKTAELAGRCKADVGCWVGKLDDPEPLVRERAALEIGRSHQWANVDDLMKHMGEQNLEVRSSLILAVGWLIQDSKEAASKARASLASIEKQLSDEKGKVEFVKVNEDLHRLAIRLRQMST